MSQSIYGREDGIHDSHSIPRLTATDGSLTSRREAFHLVYQHDDQRIFILHELPNVRKEPSYELAAL